MNLVIEIADKNHWKIDQFADLGAKIYGNLN